jgi:Flp pilus assembly pilin Flp
MKQSRARNAARRLRQLGQGMTEYIIITALIAIAAIAAVSFFGKTVRSQVAGMSKELAGQSSGSAIQKARKAAKGAETLAGKKKDLGHYGSN